MTWSLHFTPSYDSFALILIENNCFFDYTLFLKLCGINHLGLKMKSFTYNWSVVITPTWSLHFQKTRIMLVMTLILCVEPNIDVLPKHTDLVVIQIHSKLRISKDAWCYDGKREMISPFHGCFTWDEIQYSIIIFASKNDNYYTNCQM